MSTSQMFTKIAIALFLCSLMIYSSVNAIRWSTFRSWKCARICADNGVAGDVNYICSQLYVDAEGNSATGACEDVSISVQNDSYFDLPLKIVKIGVCRDTDNVIVKCVSAASADFAIRIYNVDYDTDGSFMQCGSSLEHIRPVAP